MFFEQHLIGAMQNFGYIIGDPRTKHAAVVDPSFDARILQKVAKENGYSIELIFNTHHHRDHAGPLRGAGATAVRPNGSAEGGEEGHPSRQEGLKAFPLGLPPKSLLARPQVSGRARTRD